MDLCTVKYYKISGHKPTVAFCFDNKTKEQFFIEQDKLTRILKTTIEDYKEADPNAENIFFTSIFLEIFCLIKKCTDPEVQKATLVKHQIALIAFNVLSKREFFDEPSESSNLFGLESCLGSFSKSESQLVNNYFRFTEKSLVDFFKEIPNSISREIVKDILSTLQELAELCGPRISEHMISHLKFEKFEDVEQKEDDISCSICLKEFETGDRVSILSCSHLFHFDCIATWFGRRGRCAICRNNHFVNILQSIKGTDEDSFGKNLFLVFEKTFGDINTEVFFAE